ncbi:hypothetical protein D4Q76_01630 [archaeon]|nr:MAG: hypothetical protein D4Q76_01630 [archaeon]
MKNKKLMIEAEWIDDARHANPELAGDIGKDMARYLSFEKGNTLVNFALLDAEVSHCRRPGEFYMRAVQNSLLEDLLSKDVLSKIKNGNFEVIAKRVFYDMGSLESHETYQKTGEHKIARVEEGILNPKLDKRFSETDTILYFTRENDAVDWREIKEKYERQLMFHRQIFYRKSP